MVSLFFTMTALFTEQRLARMKRQWAACQNGSNQLRHTKQLLWSLHFMRIFFDVSLNFKKFHWFSTRFRENSATDAITTKHLFEWTDKRILKHEAWKEKKSLKFSFFFAFGGGAELFPAFVLVCFTSVYFLLSAKLFCFSRMLSVSVWNINVAFARWWRRWSMLIKGAFCSDENMSDIQTRAGKCSTGRQVKTLPGLWLEKREI